LLPRRKLHVDATCRLWIHPKLQSGFETQTKKPSTWGFEAQIKPSKPSGEAYPLYLLHDLDACHRLSTTTRSPSAPAPPLDLVNHRLDLVNTVYSSTCTFSCWRPNYQPPTMISLLAPWSLGPSLMFILHRSQSISTVRLYLTVSMAVGRLCVAHLHNNTAKRYVARTLTLWLVSTSTEV
jgi:hypothetical protein